MNWFQRHLNWTWIICIILGIAVICFLDLFTNYHDDTLTFVECILVPGFIIWYLYCSIWYLKQKQLPLYYALLLFVVPACPPIGIWLFLRLPNCTNFDSKSEERRGQNDRYEADTEKPIY